MTYTSLCHNHHYSGRLWRFLVYLFPRTALRCLANGLRAGRIFVAVAFVALFTLVTPATAATNIANTVHNLTPSGPGTFKAPESMGLCVYCHTPHHASQTRALWNRGLSGATYTLYTSTTLLATVNQPNGSSRLCLSCHDGTLAMGTLTNPQNGVQPTLGVLTGQAVIGTNLSVDHPISFLYDSTLATNNGELANPLTLPSTVPLDQNSQMQCGSCHDAHEDQFPNFLRMNTIKGALCLACHQPTGWSGTLHGTSLATWNGTGTSPWPPGASPTSTVADNACEGCHRPHAAGHGPSLLAQSSEAANCTVCHGGTVATKNIQNEFNKTYHHPIENAVWTHTPKEDATLMPRHVSCADCHNAHAANASTASLPNVSGPLLGTRGINQGGTAVIPANYEYEVCYKCHGLSSATTAGLTRQDNIRNARLLFDPVNPSYHPVAAIGKNTTIQNLLLPNTASSLIGCSSCHNNDAWTSGGTAPAGVHGSIYQPILASEDLSDQTVVESTQTYALCYTCHDRNAFLTDTVGKFPHARHVIQDQEPCAACHDAHGSRTYPHLINFMLFDRNGIAVATPSTVQGLLKYIPPPAGTTTGGQCYLNCHSPNSGVNHNHEPSNY